MILQGDCREVLATLPADSVQTCVTSPPYWGLRDYGVDGQLGLEPTPEAYVANMVEVFREVRRVLRDDGTLWLNLGDSYATGGKGGGGSFMAERSDAAWQNRSAVNGWRSAPPGLKHKDLVMIPARVALALQADGWFLRAEIIWHKPNPMPESVVDRPTKAHEQIFLLSPSSSYFYDPEAIAEPAVRTDAKAWTDGGSDKQRGHGRRHAGFNGRYAERIREEGPPDTRNARSVWTIPTKPYSEAHFATFPPELARRCVLAGSKPGDTVLDPFNGAGTTGLVAQEHNREYIGIELNPEYIAISERRLSQSVLPLEVA